MLWKFACYFSCLELKMRWTPFLAGKDGLITWRPSDPGGPWGQVTLHRPLPPPAASESSVSPFWRRDKSRTIASQFNHNFNHSPIIQNGNSFQSEAEGSWSTNPKCWPPLGGVGQWMTPPPHPPSEINLPLIYYNPITLILIFFV